MPAADPTKSPGLSVFFPAYNDSGTIASLVITAIQSASKLTPDYEVIVVNDGSSDSTGQILDELARLYPQVRIVTHTVNRGYGGALRSGFARRVEGDHLLHGRRRPVRPVGNGSALAEDGAGHRSGQRLQDQPLGSAGTASSSAGSTITSSRRCSGCTCATSTATSGLCGARSSTPCDWRKTAASSASR